MPEISFSDLDFGEQLGEGASGVVYRGHWKSRDMNVAIKRVPGNINKTEVYKAKTSMPVNSRYCREIFFLSFPYRLKFSTS